MNTGTLNYIKETLLSLKKTVKKAKLPENYPEWRRESQIDLLEVVITEVDREIESNHKRSERTKRCIAKKCHF